MWTCSYRMVLKRVAKRLGGEGDKVSIEEEKNLAGTEIVKNKSVSDRGRGTKKNWKIK